jgi:nucleotide-binding universal stress UspA family protein
VPADTKLLELPGGRLGEMVAGEARNWEPDLVVVGTHGRRGVSRVLLGSGAEQVLRLSPVPVLAVRSSEPA